MPPTERKRRRVTHVGGVRGQRRAAGRVEGSPRGTVDGGLGEDLAGDREASVDGQLICERVNSVSQSFYSLEHFAHNFLPANANQIS